MKTPKRKLTCPNCEEEIIIERYRDGSRDRLQFRCPSGCTLHRQDVFYHGNVREFYRLTRWKRKNRDRQQRRIIAALANLCEQAQGQVLSVANCYYRLLELDASSAMGQDIEGS